MRNTDYISQPLAATKHTPSLRGKRQKAPQRHPSQEGNLGRSINNRLGISETISSFLENLREKTRFSLISSTDYRDYADSRHKRFGLFIKSFLGVQGAIFQKRPLPAGGKKKNG